MNTQSRAPFWLEVKKEYIIENFDNLVKYLREYSTHPDEMSVIKNPASDFGRTFSCLKELTYDYVAEKSGDSIYSYENIKWEDISFILRIMFTYILSDKIREHTDYKVLAKIADILLLSGFATTRSSIMGLKRIVVGCLTESKVSNYGISWAYIQDWDAAYMSPEIICSCLGNTTFEQNDEKTYCCEGLGCVTLENGIIHIAPMNISDYGKDNKKVNLFSLASGVDFDILKSNYTTHTKNYSELKETCSDILSIQNSIKASPVINKKTYKAGDELVVKVIGHHEYGIRAQSVDSNYEQVSGKVYAGGNFVNNVNYKDFKENLSIGDYVLVKFQDNQNFPFTIGTCFDDFYEHYIYSSDCERKTYGIFISEYSKGYQWLTINGIFVNIQGKYDDNTPIGQSKANRTPVSIDIKNPVTDANGHLLVNATYSDEEIDDEIDSPSSFIQQAKGNLVIAFSEYAEKQKPLTLSNGKMKYKSFDKMYIDVLAHFEYTYASKVLDTSNRYTHLFFARFLSGINENTKDGDYISMEMNFQNCLVQFSSGYDPKLIEFKPKEDLLTIDSVQWRTDIISKLNEYVKESRTMTDIEFQNLSLDDKKRTLDGLIKSSNLINDKISQPEVYRIKKQIAVLLNVGDEFVIPKMELTYYGEESDTLEFKSSAVFPPKNEDQADPNKQLWKILSNICAFLNTLSGGELILGVLDIGISCGLKEDLEYLYKNKIIVEDSMDKYRNYIKMHADKAFIDDSNISKEKEITTGRVTYIIEKNKENHDILRIQVRPYEYGIVLFNNKRPDYIEQGYIRTSGATVVMTDEMKVQARERKMRASYDGNMQKLIILKKACKERKQVVLIDYLSQSKKERRVVEPYKALPEHDAFLCYDTSVDENPIREFKISRIGQAEILPKSWMNSHKHRDRKIDIFGMLQDSDKKPYKVKLKLNSLAYNLLREEYKNSGKDLSTNSDTEDSNEYPWILETDICKDEGIGRFYIGLANSIKIVEGKQLIKYVQDFVSANLANIH